jgi:hypothetical protein
MITNYGCLGNFVAGYSYLKPQVGFKIKNAGGAFDESNPDSPLGVVVALAGI